MTDPEILDELADILGAAPGTLAPETPLAPPLTWDSMALLAYLAFLRFRFGLTLPGVSCAAFRTVGDLMARCPREG